LGAELAREVPWAESALAAFLLAGCLTLIPILRQPEIELASLKDWRALCQRDFLLYLGATLSVVMALFLFSSADRIVARSWFEHAENYAGWGSTDSYQTAGLLGRSLLWGTQPLLLIFFLRRARTTRTTSDILNLFWIYLGVLVAGALLLTLLRRPLCEFFGGENVRLATMLVPFFALVMTLLGIIQGLGIFALASRRYIECFVLGGASIGYTALLYFAGRQPVLMLTYMFGAGLFSLMLVLFVGIVRWGRRQP